MTPNSIIEIRLAGSQDAGLVADISRRTFYDSFVAHNSKENMDLFMNEQFTREMQMAEVGASGRVFLLAYLDGEPVGYASMRDRQMDPPRGLEGARAIEIVQLYSEQRTIGKGIGKALMRRCLEIAREKNKEWIFLGVWEHNSRAITFYTKWGFERFGEHLFMVGRDPQTDWWMKRKV
jgi:GNAT superfamily N-acetyltransferase